jgi:hypothetical protein
MVPRGSDGATIGKNILHKLTIKLDAKYPCKKGIQVCIDKGTDPH